MILEQVSNMILEVLQVESLILVVKMICNKSQEQ